MRQVLGAGALGRPRGMGWRGRQEGGSGWGIHVNLWLIHVNVWQKPLQYCKVISRQLVKINGKKKKKKRMPRTFEMRTLQCPWGQDLLLTLHDSELLEPFLIFSPLRFPWTSRFTWTEWASRNQGNPWNSR